MLRVKLPRQEWHLHQLPCSAAHVHHLARDWHLLALATALHIAQCKCLTIRLLLDAGDVTDALAICSAQNW